jgi:hypothetical protein
MLRCGKPNPNGKSRFFEVGSAWIWEDPTWYNLVLFKIPIYLKPKALKSKCTNLRVDVPSRRTLSRAFPYTGSDTSFDPDMFLFLTSSSDHATLWS